jgi:hypothetical protein
MTKTTTTNQVIGAILIVLGALLLLGWLDIPFLGTIVGIALIVLGLLAVVGAGPMPKNGLLGIILVALGVVVLIPTLGVGGAVAGLLETVVAIVLIVVGILKVMGRM